MLKKEIIKTEKAFISQSPLSQAVRVGTMLYISGQVPVDTKTMQVVSEDFVTQAMYVLNSVKSIVEAAGGSLDNIVKTTVYLTDMARFNEMNEIYKTFFMNEPPARTCIGVKELPRKSQIEIEAIAMF